MNSQLSMSEVEINIHNLKGWEGGMPPLFN